MYTTREQLEKYKKNVPFVNMQMGPGFNFLLLIIFVLLLIKHLIFLNTPYCNGIPGLPPLFKLEIIIGQYFVNQEERCSISSLTVLCLKG